MAANYVEARPVRRAPHVLWRTPGSARNLLASPRAVVLARRGSPSPVLDPATGRQTGEIDSIGERPAIVGDAVVSLTPSGLAAHDLATGRKTAEWPAVSAHFDVHGYVDLANGRCRAFAWTRDSVWSRPLSGGTVALTRTRVYADGAALDRATGREIWRYSDAEFLEADDAGIVGRGREAWGAPLVAFDADGALLWRTSGGLDASVAALTPEVVVGLFHGYDSDPPGFIVLDRRTGRPSARVEEGDVWTVLVASDVIFAGEPDALVAYTTSGDRLWRHGLPGSATTGARAIAATDGRIYIDALDDWILCLGWAS